MKIKSMLFGAMLLLSASSFAINVTDVEQITRISISGLTPEQKLHVINEVVELQNQQRVADHKVDACENSHHEDREAKIFAMIVGGAMVIGLFIFLCTLYFLRMMNK